ncbi:MAG: ankyrin repeat domain-containing protein [Gammaproteobacteria bacterium]
MPLRSVPRRCPIIRGRIRRVEPRAGRQRVRDLASPEAGAFLKRPTERTLRFLRAAEHGRLDVAKLLLAGGVDVRAKGHSGESSLHSAAGNGQAEMVGYLAPLIGEPDVRDDFGGTPLLWAARQHKIEVTRLLLELGADSKAIDKHRQTALHGTADHSDLCDDDYRIAQLLLDGGANVNAKDDLGRTSLHVAARDGHLEMARLLLGAGAEVDAETAAGEAPLHLAAEGSHKEMIRVLLQAGAAVNVGDSVGRTPLHRHLGSRCRRKEIVSLLLTSGANVNANDKQGRTVLHEAARRNPRDPLAELLRKHGAQD